MRVKRKSKKTLGFLVRRIHRLITNPIFLWLTIIGNSVITFGTLLLYYLEVGVNPTIDSLLDTLWWSVSTVTTVGYGDVSPITPAGKFTGIFMMIVGTALFWSYTALFAEALVSGDIDDVESEIRSLERRIRALGSREDIEATQMNDLINAMKDLSNKSKEKEMQ